MARYPDQTFEGLVMQRTAKALLFWGWYWHGPLWLPLSQVHIDVDGDGFVVKVKGWLANKNNLQEFTEYTETDIEERTYHG